MKRFGKYLKEDEDTTQKSILKNPAYMHNSYGDALQAAQRMAVGESDINSRTYIIKYKYYYQTHSKPYIVIDRRELISQEPNFDTKGYEIQGWVSPKDGVVKRLQDGTYVKDQGK